MSTVMQELTTGEVHPVGSAEQQLLQQIVDRVREAGLKTDRQAIVNLYVALKSKPMALLVGPAGSGKNIIIRCFAEVLTGGNPLRCQLLAGHAWWAEQTGNVGQFATGQSRFNDQKLLSLMEEALQPENEGAIHLASLASISAAELDNVFTDLSVQLSTRVHRLATIWLQDGLPYPPNLLLIGTMDTQFDPEVDADLYRHTGVVWWAADQVQQLPRDTVFAPYGQHTAAGQRYRFLDFAIRDELLAWKQLATVVGWRQLDLAVWHAVKTLFRKHGYGVSDDVRTETMVHLANAWDGQGQGLFSDHAATNSVIALDFALAQIVFPRMKRELRASPLLFAELADLTGEQLPYAYAWLKVLRR